MTASKIEWTDRSDWNPIRGCTRTSPGCGGPGAHGGCYAETMAARFSDPGQWGHGFAERTAKGGRWTGKVEIQWDRVSLPLGWQKPARIFASSTSDFFHEALDMLDVAQLFGVMIAAHHLRGHTFQVLTKRADRMRAWLNDEEFWDIANAEADMRVMERVDPHNRRSDDARATLEDYGPDEPPPGIWLGISVEDQQRADERVPDLLATPAVVRFLSCEPLLGPVDLASVCDGWSFWGPLSGRRWHDGDGEGPAYSEPCPKLDWVITGGESGPTARPMHPDWARRLRDQCLAAGVAFHFKQWGEYRPCTSDELKQAGGATFLGGDRHSPANYMMRPGKKRAGRLLDGVQHDGMPT
jgi:protein gp37